MENFAVRAHQFLKQAKAALVAKGYPEATVHATISDSRAFSFYYSVPNSIDPSNNYSGWLGLTFGEDTPEDEFPKIEERAGLRIVEEFSRIPDKKDAPTAAILNLVSKIRELAPEAALPDDWINPIEALAEKLRSNIIEHKP